MPRHLSIPNVNLDRLIQDQTKFIQGIQPFDVARSTVPLTGRFRPNLDRALDTGFRSDTGAAKESARAVSGDVLQDTFGAIDERLAAKGLTGSSAQSQQLVTAGQRSANSLADLFANLDFAADESAAGRRVGALGSALGEGSVANVSRGLDQGEAQLGLSGRAQQAGAGQSLIDALLRSVPFEQPRAAQPPGITQGVMSSPAPQGPDLQAMIRQLTNAAGIENLSPGTQVARKSFGPGAGLRSGGMVESPLEQQRNDLIRKGNRDARLNLNDNIAMLLSRFGGG